MGQETSVTTTLTAIGLIFFFSLMLKDSCSKVHRYSYRGSSSVFPVCLPSYWYQKQNFSSTLLHSEGPKLYGVLALLSTIGLRVDSILEGLCCPGKQT